MKCEGMGVFERLIPSISSSLLSSILLLILDPLSWDLPLLKFRLTYYFNMESASYNDDLLAVSMIIFLNFDKGWPAVIGFTIISFEPS